MRLRAGARVMPRRNSGNRPLRVTGLSHEMPSISADENNHSRTRATGLDAELDRVHRKRAQMERDLKRADVRVGLLRRHLRRRTGALWTAFMTLGPTPGMA
ncbi:hypothetical protein ABZ436_08445 [Micromonospora matsumotoense]|uniref:hypothetical protein n=1 Tax=Micromonospora matsumotoense TaxID=121616 RepID=UPI0033D1A728